MGREAVTDDKKEKTKVCLVCRRILTDPKLDDGKYIVCDNDYCPRFGLLSVAFLVEK